MSSEITLQLQSKNWEIITQGRCGAKAFLPFPRNVGRWNKNYWSAEAELISFVLSINQHPSFLMVLCSPNTCILFIQTQLPNPDEQNALVWDMLFIYLFIFLISYLLSFFTSYRRICCGWSFNLAFLITYVKFFRKVIILLVTTKCKNAELFPKSLPISPWAKTVDVLHLFTSVERRFLIS